MSKRNYRDDSPPFAEFTPAESGIAAAIGRRAEKAFANVPGFKYHGGLGVVMDLQAVSYHTPMRLADLSLADDFNFAHDVLGIFGNLDRFTGKLCNHFEPRFAVQRIKSALTRNVVENAYC